MNGLFSQGAEGIECRGILLWPTRSESRSAVIPFLCHLAAALLLAGAGAYLLFGRDKGLGIFLVLLAAILSRVLVLNIGARFAPPVSRKNGERDGPPD